MGSIQPEAKAKSTKSAPSARLEEAARVTAEVELEQRREGEEPEQAFAEAYHAWLRAKAGPEDLLMEEDEGPSGSRPKPMPSAD